MSRDYKFRAWNKKRKRMYEVLHLHLASGREGDWATVKGYDCIEDKDIHIQIQPKEIELMQYTGLKDRNGKEIYEGDKVLLDYNRLGVMVVMVVKYDDGAYNIMGRMPLDKIEVVGNIYETREETK